MYQLLRRNACTIVRCVKYAIQCQWYVAGPKIDCCNAFQKNQNGLLQCICKNPCLLHTVHNCHLAHAIGDTLDILSIPLDAVCNTLAHLEHTVCNAISSVHAVYYKYISIAFLVLKVRQCSHTLIRLHDIITVRD
jgi:hypothetical protein